MRLTPRVSLVGSGEADWALTDPADCQVYLVHTSSGAICIDAGTGASVDAILAAAKQDGTDPESIRWLYLTHAHADHAGGVAAWRERLPALRVAMAAEAADWIRAGDEEATSLAAARAAGIFSPDYRLRAGRIDRELIDGERVQLDSDLFLTVVATPGHSHGHLAFIVDDHIDTETVRLAFSGDALFPGGLVLLQDTWDCDLRQTLRSVERLAALHPDQLFAGHLAPQMGDVDATFATALGRITHLVPPRNLL
jgi:hydroxyacylglutathione hydrolase